MTNEKGVMKFRGTCTSGTREEVTPTYSTQNFFKLNNKFIQDDLLEHSKILNTHYDPCFNMVNALAMDLILNNCHPDMLRKVTKQLEAIDKDKRSGALVLFSSFTALLFMHLKRTQKPSRRLSRNSRSETCQDRILMTASES